VHATMRELGAVAVEARAALLAGDVARLHELVDFNFELRRRIVPIRESHGRMVEVARGCGASAHFTGSGGAITGVCADEDFARLKQQLSALGCRVLRPQVG